MRPYSSERSFDELLHETGEGHPPDRAGLMRLLNPQQGPEQTALFAAARAVRRRHFGDGVFLYGFVYTSTHCRNECAFCYYRRSNIRLPRYRKSRPEAVAAACRLAEAGVHLIDLTMGEDPALYRNGEAGFDALAGLIFEVRCMTGLPVMVSPGAPSAAVLDQLAVAGADWYACYQETHNPALFSSLRPGQDFSQRMARKRQARRLGLLIEEGVLCGVGESDADLAESIIRMREMEVDQARAMTFVPQADTPLAGRPAGSDLRELTVMAVMRLALPDRLIPASLDVRGLDGLRDRLRAGANVVTSIVPPGSGLAGVANSELDIETSRRSCESVRRVLGAENLQAASLAEYRKWIGTRRRAVAAAAFDAGVREPEPKRPGAGPAIPALHRPVPASIHGAGG